MKEFLQKHRKRIVTGAVVLCVLGGGTYYYMDSLNANQAQTLYTTGKVEKGDVKTSISATGTINPVNYVDVSTNVAGKLEKVLVKENDQVTAGQVIAYIDTRQLQASVDDARALANNPAIIMADEPTGNLDSKSTIDVMNIFRGLHDEGRTILLVTHEPDIATYASRNVVLKDGIIVEDSINSNMTPIKEVPNV